MILQCVCKHEYQDEQYGKNNRVHNSCLKGYRCTVCGNVVVASGQKKEDKKDA